MTTKIFINWDKQEVLTKTAYQAKVAEVKSDKNEFDDFKCDWLADEVENYIRYTLKKSLNTETIFNLTDEDKQKIYEELHRNYERSVEEDFETDWEEFEIEV